MTPRVRVTAPVARLAERMRQALARRMVRAGDGDAGEGGGEGRLAIALPSTSALRNARGIASVFRFDDETGEG